MNDQLKALKVIERVVQLVCESQDEIQFQASMNLHISFGR